MVDINKTVTEFLSVVTPSCYVVAMVVLAYVTGNAWELRVQPKWKRHCKFICGATVMGIITLLFFIYARWAMHSKLL